MKRPPPRSTLFPYTTLFRSSSSRAARVRPSAASCSTSARSTPSCGGRRSEEHTSELQSRSDLVCRLLLEKKKVHTSGSAIVRHNGGPDVRLSLLWLHTSRAG